MSHLIIGKQLKWQPIIPPQSFVWGPDSVIKKKSAKEATAKLLQTQQCADEKFENDKIDRIDWQLTDKWNLQIGFEQIQQSIKNKEKSTRFFNYWGTNKINHTF